MLEERALNRDARAVAPEMLLPRSDVTLFRRLIMDMILPVAAAGYSLIYLLLGGGFGGAVLIFIVAKMLGK